AAIPLATARRRLTQIPRPLSGKPDHRSGHGQGGTRGFVTEKVSSWRDGRGLIRTGRQRVSCSTGRVAMKRPTLSAEMKFSTQHTVFSTQHTVRVLAGAILLISLGGCGAIDLVATKIGDYKQFEVPNVDTFLILDDINAQKIKITMSTGAKASAFMNNI